jgi:hypothetical protein
MNTTACADGITLSVSSGSARMRVLDQCVAPGRHVDQAVLAQWRVVGRRRGFVVGARVVAPQAQLARLVDADGARARHFHQGERQFLVAQVVQRHMRPDAAAQAQVGQRTAFDAGFDRQQRQHGRLALVVGHLHRAHRGAPRRGGQHAPAGVAEEHGVDQLGLAARELGDEGDRQLVAGQALAQALELFAGMLVQQALAPKVLGKLRHGRIQGCTPGIHAVQALRQ